MKIVKKKKKNQGNMGEVNPQKKMHLAQWDPLYCGTFPVRSENDYSSVIICFV